MAHPGCCSSRAGYPCNCSAEYRADRVPAPARPHILALRAAQALTTLRTWLAAPGTDITPHLTVARDALGAIVDVFGACPTGEQARSHRDALMRPGGLPDAAALKVMADAWRDTAGRLAARVGARLPEGTVRV